MRIHSLTMGYAAMIFVSRSFRVWYSPDFLDAPPVLPNFDSDGVGIRTQQV
jgi:hypothetical protein